MTDKTIEKKIVAQFLKTMYLKYPDFKESFPTIEKACELALKVHTGQKRKYSGNPYIDHPLNVALLWAKRFHDPLLVIASILHDCVEDGKHTEAKDIYELFWEEIWFIVDAVSDTSNYFFHEPEIVFHDKIEKFLHWGIHDVRCILLKLHDREHNISTLEWLEPHKQIRMSFETQAIYEPLKKLFWWYKNKKQSIANCNVTLEHYLSANNIRTAEEFKETLLNQTFFDFDNDTFNLVYKNTSRIFWKIDDKKVFEKLIETKNFDEKIDVISLQKSANWKFLVIFRYKEGKIFEDLNGKLIVHTTFS